METKKFRKKITGGEKDKTRLEKRWSGTMTRSYSLRGEISLMVRRFYYVL